MTRRTRIASYGLVLDSGRILLCRIAPHIRDHGGRWTLPGGGIDFGEDPIDAVVREVEEETGLRVAPTGLAGIDSFVAPDGESLTHSVRIIYFCEVVGGELADEVDGSTDRCAWHDLNAITSVPLVALVQRGLECLPGDGSTRP